MGTNSKKIGLRVFTAILMFCFIMWGYWWLTWCFAIALLFYFPNYYEIILWGVMYDALYVLGAVEFSHVRIFFTLISIMLFIIAFFLRKRLSAYE